MTNSIENHPTHCRLSPTTPARGLWVLIFLSSLVLMITMGIRQTVGLFVHPLIGTTSMSITEMSMALASSQLMWGVFQPLL